MQTIIAQAGQHAYPNPDAAARQRRDRLAKATTDQMESALAFLSMIDPEAFEIALTAVTPAADHPEDAEAIPLCRRCGAGSPPSPTAACTGSTSAAASRPAPSRPTTQVTPSRSPGSSPTRVRKSSSLLRNPAPRRSFRRGTDV